MSLNVEEGQIRLMKNPKYTEGGKQPVLTGSLKIDGQSKDVAVWKAKNGNGFNGQVKEPYRKKETYGAERYQQNNGGNDNPF